LALAATGAEFEEILIQLDISTTKTEIERYSQAGRVPVLIDGELVIWDTLAIIEYLAEKFPAAGLWSNDVGTRALQRSICAEMHSGFAALRNAFPMNMRKTIPGRGVSPDVQIDIDRICFVWRQVLDKDPAGGPYLFGRFSAADAMFAPVISRFVTYRFPVGDSERAYMDAILSNTHFQTWMQAAEAEPWILGGEEI